MINNWIGIDPDSDKSGVCFVCGKNISVTKYSFSSIVYNLIPQLTKKNNYCIIIEASWKIKHIYNRYRGFSTNIASNIAMKVGRNHAVGEKILECAKANNLIIKEVLPLTKDENAKLSHLMLMQIIQNRGFVPLFKNTNQDERDAISLTLHYMNNLSF